MITGMQHVNTNWCCDGNIISSFHLYFPIHCSVDLFFVYTAAFYTWHFNHNHYIVYCNPMYLTLSEQFRHAEANANFKKICNVVVTLPPPPRGGWAHQILNDEWLSQATNIERVNEWCRIQTTKHPTPWSSQKWTVVFSCLSNSMRIIAVGPHNQSFNLCVSGCGKLWNDLVTFEYAFNRNNIFVFALGF